MSPVPVELDADGPRATGSPAQCTTVRKVVSLQPRGQNPTGVSLRMERARSSPTLLDRTGATVIEDDSLDGIATQRPVSLGSLLPGRACTCAASPRPMARTCASPQ